MTPDDDALRARLARLDPASPSLAVDPPSSLRAQELLERTMSSPLTNSTTTTGTEQTTGTKPASGWRRPALLAAAAAAVIAVGIGAVLAGGGGSGAPAKATTSIALKGQGGGLSVGSCIPFSVDILKGMPVAFAGTATSVTADQVTLTVDHWYRGGTADQVTVATPVTSEGPGEFTLGKRYLITATDGTVNGCGYTGDATADLEKYFTQAFAP